MKEFVPDYRNIVSAAWNQEAKRLPLYEHIVSFTKIDEIEGTNIAPLAEGGAKELEEFFNRYCHFFAKHGYDAVPFEGCIGQILPGGGALGDSRVDPVIKTRQDFERYPWGTLQEAYFARFGPYFTALRKAMPMGMQGVGGVGNGVFESVQELVGFQNLCYLAMDDPELYADLFKKVGAVSLTIWERFMKEYGDIYCVLRFGDDLGYRAMTLLSVEDIKTHIVPRYTEIIAHIHRYKKPFLLHSCGKIFDVMEDLMGAGINAKHSNEDEIAPFPVWVERYGDRIGNFGGIDTDTLCRCGTKEIKEQVKNVVGQCAGKGGFALGSGNSIPDYVPPEGYLAMIEALRELRGD